jgi:hypothetical protein
MYICAHHHEWEGRGGGITEQFHRQTYAPQFACRENGGEGHVGVVVVVVVVVVAVVLVMVGW